MDRDRANLAETENNLKFCADEIQWLSFPPTLMSSSSSYYCSLLKQCRETLNHKLVKKLHCLIIKTQKHQDVLLSNNLVALYGKLNILSYARNVFDNIPHPNMFSWNILLSAYSNSGELREMQQVFNRIPSRDGISWNALISGYANHGLFSEAVGAYRSMFHEGNANLNRITFSTMLILSLNRDSLGLGRQLHSQILKFGFNHYVFVGNPLMDMYSKLRYIDDAQRVFDEMPERNLVMYNTMIAGYLRCGMVESANFMFHSMQEKDSISWTTMITGLVQNNFHEEAINTVRDMIAEGFPLDQFTFGGILTACGGLLALEQGTQIHAHIIRNGYHKNIFAGSALVDMYCKCRNIKYAERVFDRMRDKNIVSWTTMVGGYGQNGLTEKALKTFHKMKNNGVSPDYFTLASVISSCANIASLEEGTQFHTQAVISGLLKFVTVCNALISFYGKCGSIEDSHKLFNEMGIKDEVSWTAVLSGYAQFGKVKETIILYEEMLANGVKPDGITFSAILSACSRSGLVEKGKDYYESMVKQHGVEPSTDHYTCMIDLLGRSGRLNEAKEFIMKMPCKPDVFGWSTLLSSCRVHGNMEIGKWAAESLLEIEPRNSVGYVLLSSIYAATGNWDEVARIRKEMRDNGVKKEAGYSWIKFKNKVYVFSADDKSSPYLDMIYSELEKLQVKMIEEGYKADVECVLHEVECSEKMRILSRHSERLAIVFGLIFVPRGVPIRVMKNLRVCVDCHNATKIISKVTRREILVRDAVRFHLFKDGTCSCGDFW